jgi:hypothetical protein
VEGAGASIFEPAPANLRAVLRIRDLNIREAWLKAYCKELKTIIDLGTFKPELPLDGETCTPIMDMNVIKLKSDGTLNKLKIILWSEEICKRMLRRIPGLQLLLSGLLNYFWPTRLAFALG